MIEIIKLLLLFNIILRQKIIMKTILIPEELNFVLLLIIYNLKKNIRSDLSFN